MEFDFARLAYRPGEAVTPTAVTAPANSELAPEAVIELWQERSTIQATDNTDLTQWHESIGSAPEDHLRACELNAAAELSLTLGQYVEPIIHPHLTKRRLTEDERVQNIERSTKAFDDRVKRGSLAQCKECNGWANLDPKENCDDCVEPVCGKNKVASEWSDSPA